MTQPYYQPPQQPVPPVQPVKQKGHWLRTILISAGALVLGIIFGSVGGGADPATAGPEATVTVTATATETVTAEAPKGEAAKPAPTKTVTATVTAKPEKPKEPEKATIGDGSWLVGSDRDMAPGQYRTTGDVADQGGMCYAETLDENGEILENWLEDSGRVIVNVPAAADVFNSDSCGTWEKIG